MFSFYAIWYFTLDVDLLCHILSEFKQILQSPQTNMENVHFVCNILQNIWCTINLENKVCLHILK